MRRRLAVLLLSSAVLGSVALAEEIPSPLTGWKDWVLDGQEHRRCPFWMAGDYGDAESHVCAWPQRLRLEAGKSGGRFAIAWTAFAETWLPLPGDPEHWPLEVKVDGAAAPVVEHDGGPALWVRAGRHHVVGTLAWTERPESLRVPDGIALVDLILDGQAVFPLQRAEGSLWLGRAGAAAGQADSLSVHVYRKLTDDLPPRLETRIRLDVSGQGREEILGPVLPAGYVPTGVESPLTTVLDSDGRMRVQIRPGNWQIVVGSRGLAPLVRLSLVNPGGAWPAEEVWSYEASPGLRVTSAAGGRSIDPSQADVPEEWRQLPAFAMSEGRTLEIEERSRGMAGDDANRLELRREMWLDFSGTGLTVRDGVTGRMVQGFRLDLAEPFALQRASAAGAPLLVTRGPGPGLTGVELRNPQLRLEASSRVERAAGRLPVTGWRTRFENVAVTLRLPPARELVAAIGADSSPDAWVDRWSLLDVFLLLVTSLLAFRLLGLAGGGLAFVFLGLSYHESVAPLWALLVLLLVALLHRALPPGRMAAVVGVLRGAAVLSLALVALPFVAHELRLVLYPQLEGGTAEEYGRRARFGDLALAAPPPAPPPPQAAQVPKEQPETKQLEVTVEEEATLPSAGPDGGVRIDKAARQLQRYAASNVFQAGGGELEWSWRQATLSWGGPVPPEQTVRLIVTPAWLTRLLRVILVGLFVLLLARLAKAMQYPLGFRLGEARPTAALIGVLLAGTGLAPAQQTPDPALLEQLKARLLEAPECAPSCGHLEDAVVEAGRDRLDVTLTVHAAALVAVPVPGSEAAWRIAEIRVDGSPRPELLRQESGLWVPLDRGVHRVELRGILAPVDSLDLRFPVAPARVRLRGTGWDASGLRDGRLITDTLGLVRVRGRGEAAGAGGAATRVPPFVRVTRDLDLDLDWSVTTRVERVAPVEGSLTAEVPLLPGESVLTPGFEARDGKVTAALGAGVDEVSWESRLERAERLELAFADLRERAEIWRATVSPQWRADFAGVPPSMPAGSADYWVHEFHPLPGEKLTLEVSRPEPVAGATLAMDRASLRSKVGRRTGEHSLSLDLRATRGGQHAITLPAGAEVLEVKIDGAVVNVRPEAGRLTLPVHPGAQPVLVRWRDPGGAGLVYRMPAVGLGASASNLALDLSLPTSRWVLGTSGPRLGPAVLYWGELLVMGLVAFLLSRLARSPLKLYEWLLLGIGFSTVSWVALAIVVGWLLLLAARGRLERELPWWRFDIMQVALIAVTVAALVCLISSVPYGLLGSPDMRIAGNESRAYDLRWFADRTDGPLPSTAALSLPLWVYRLAMLVWALWLASAVVGWLRWGFDCWTANGAWRKRPRAAAQPEADGKQGQTSLT